MKRRRAHQNRNVDDELKRDFGEIILLDERRLAATRRGFRGSHALVEQFSGTGVREDDEAGLPRALRQHRAA